MLPHVRQCPKRLALTKDVVKLCSINKETNVFKRILFALISTTLISCGGTTSGGYNETAQLGVVSPKAEKKDYKTLVLADVNFGKPSRVHVQPFEYKVDKLVIEYMSGAGYEFLPSHVFTNAWNNAIRQTGATYDPTTGRLNDEKHLRALGLAIDYLKQNTKADAVIFTDLLDFEVPFNIGNNHNAKWHGVERRFTKIGVGNSVPAGFDWSKPVEVSSLWINVFDLETSENVYRGIGGIDSTMALNMKLAEPSFSRRKDLFKRDEYISEGISLALHPLIRMGNWPGNPSK